MHDNYTTCPLCQNTLIDKIAHEKAEISSMYGKVSEEEYTALVAAGIKNEKRIEKKMKAHTLGEDVAYNIGSGMLNIGYSCVCSDCGFNYVIDFENINLLDPDVIETIKCTINRDLRLSVVQKLDSRIDTGERKVSNDTDKSVLQTLKESGVDVKVTGDTDG